MQRNLAELNIGRLVAEPGDPRVAAFMSALDRVNGIGKRSPGFVWMMEGSGEPGTGNTETKIGGDTRFVSNFTVWDSIDALGHFVWNTLHRQFCERLAEWCALLAQQHFVMGWVPAGHRPSLDEALARLDHRMTQGDTEHAFGWNWLDEAKHWRTQRYAPEAAK